MDIFVLPNDHTAVCRLQVRGDPACWVNLTREQAIGIAHKLLDSVVKQPEQPKSLWNGMLLTVPVEDVTDADS